MSVRSDIIGDFANTFSNTIDSATTAAQAYSNSQFNRINTMVTEDYNAFLEELQNDNNFEGYDQRVENFWADEEQKVRNGGYGGIATNVFLNNKMPEYQSKMNQSVKDMKIDGYWTMAKSNYNLAVETVLDNPEMTYSDKVAAINSLYDSHKMKDMPIRYGVAKDPMAYNEEIKSASLQQSFSQMTVEPFADAYFYEGMTVDQIFETLKAESGISNWREIDENTAKAYVRSALSSISSIRKAEATNAQSQVGEYFATLDINGVSYTASDVIEYARQHGAVRNQGMENETVDRNWISFLSPYLEQDKIDRAEIEAALKMAEELELAETVTPEFIDETVTGLENGDIAVEIPQEPDNTIPEGSVAATPSKEVVVTPDNKVLLNGEEVPLTVHFNEDGSITAENNGDVIDGLEQYVVGGTTSSEASRENALNRNYVTQDIEFTSIPEAINAKVDDLMAQGVGEFEAHEQAVREVKGAVDNGEELKQSASYSENGETGRPVTHYLLKATPVFADYVPDEGNAEPQLSDQVLAKQAEVTQSAQSMAGQAGFKSLFSEDGSVIYDHWTGKATYKAEGYPDLACDYEPVVYALCEKLGIEYSKTSPAVYTIASQVQSLGNSGAFTSTNKQQAVFDLAYARLDPEVTPNEYSQKLLKYKVSGTLSDVEIEEYGLEKSSFSGDLEGTTFRPTYELLCKNLFKAVFNKDYTTDRESSLKLSDASQWLQLKTKASELLTQKYLMDIDYANANTEEVITGIIDQLTDETIEKDLYNILTGNIPNTIASDVDNFQVGFSTIVDVLKGDWSDFTVSFMSVTRPDETQTGKDVLDAMFTTGQYGEYVDTEILNYISNDLYNEAILEDKGKTANRTAKKEMDSIAQNRYGKNYKELPLEEQRTVCVSYMYGRTRAELKKYTAQIFGYEIKDIYADVVIDGVGMAVVTKDGRIYIPNGTPDGSGHKWLIGSVSGRTLSNIQKGSNIISYQEASVNGLYEFSDDGLRYDSYGSNVSRKFRGDKDNELWAIYSTVQPDRYQYL